MTKQMMLALILFLANCSSMLALAKSWTEAVSEGIRLKSSGSYLEAIAAFREGLSMAQAAGVLGLPLFEIYDHLASAYAEAGQHGEAAHQYREALSWLEKLEGKSSLDYAVVFGKMALLPGQGESNEQAIRLMQQTLRAHDATLSSDQPDSVRRKLLMLQNAVAQLLIRTNRVDEAERVLLQFRSALLSGPHDNEMLADALIQLGALRFNQGQYEQAAAFDRECLQAHEEADGDRHPHLIRPLNNLANAYAKSSRFKEAAALYQRAIALCAKTLGEDQFVYGVLLQNYGDILRKLGNKQEGAELRSKGTLIQKTFLARNGAGVTITIDALRGGSAR